MVVKISKKDNGEIYYVLEGKSIDFDYDGLSLFIERFYSNNEIVDLECEDELNEYRELLKNILLGCRETDYVNAVNEALENQKELSIQERVLDDYIDLSCDNEKTED